MEFTDPAGIAPTPTDDEGGYRESRLAVILTGAAIGSILALVGTGVVVPAASGLIYAAIGAIGSVTGAALAVLGRSVRRRT